MSSLISSGQNIFDVELTGFSTGEIDLLIDGSQHSAAVDPADELAGLGPEGPAVSQLGDVWELGRHRLACGDARKSNSVLEAGFLRRNTNKIQPRLRAI